jgi:thiol-disulfide isomerase/thioredoxin
MNRFVAKATLMVAILAVAGSGALAAQEKIKLDPVPKGASQSIGYYVPKQIALSPTVPSTLKKAPKLKNPLYVIIPAKSDGDRIFHVILDESSASKSILYVDTNGDGDLTNDPQNSWAAYKSSDGFMNWMGDASITLTQGAFSLDAHLGIYQFDKKNPSAASYKNTLFVYRDYAYAGKIKFGDKNLTVMLSDDAISGDFSAKGTMLLIDRDGNGSIDSRWESFDIKAPFALEGQSYELTDVQSLGGGFTIIKSSQSVAELKAPPDHAIGKKITSFTATDMDGKTVNFPQDFAGKIVMLDFWATWCGPCMEEVPGLAECYAKYKDKGFTVLGVTLDSAKADAQLRAVMKEKNMLWPEIYDGKGWKAEIAQMYFIQSIPSSFLVDGDTGEILSTGGNLRGQWLRATIEQALKKKGKL